MEDRRLPLFAGKEPSWNTVRQQNVANCPLPAALAAIARTCPGRLRALLSEVDAPYVSWFNNEPERVRWRGERLIHVHFQEDLVRVTPLLYYPSDRTKQEPLFAHSRDGGGWPAYIEKAYVVLRGRHEYAFLDAGDSPQPPTTDRVLFDLIGRHLHVELGKGYQDSEVFAGVDGAGRTTSPLARLSSSSLRALLSRATSQATLLTTPSTPRTLTGSHTYVALKRSGETLSIWDARNGQSRDVPLASFFAEFDGLFQVNQGCN